MKISQNLSLMLFVNIGPDLFEGCGHGSCYANTEILQKIQLYVASLQKTKRELLNLWADRTEQAHWLVSWQYSSVWADSTNFYPLFPCVSLFKINIQTQNFLRILFEVKKDIFDIVCLVSDGLTQINKVKIQEIHDHAIKNQVSLPD